MSVKIVKTATGTVVGQTYPEPKKEVKAEKPAK